MDDAWSTGDAALLESLHRMWSELDPPPAGLADDLIAALAVGDLAEEWEHLQLVRGDLSGIRSSSEVSTLQFDLGSVSLVVRLAPESAATRRLDGWIVVETPSEPGIDGRRVVLVTDTQERTEVVDSDGRFAFDGIRGNRWRLRFRASDGGRRLQTPDMPL